MSTDVSVVIWGPIERTHIQSPCERSSPWRLGGFTLAAQHCACWIGIPWKSWDFEPAVAQCRGSPRRTLMAFRSVGAFLVALLFTSGNAFAQVKAGLNELTFSASVFGTKTEGSDTATAATLTGSYGRFLGDHLEVGPLLSVSKAEGVDAFGTIGGYGAFHVNTASAVVPYVGAQIGRGFGLASDFNDNPWVFGFFGGIKAF